MCQRRLDRQIDRGEFHPEDSPSQARFIRAGLDAGATRRRRAGRRPFRRSRPVVSSAFRARCEPEFGHRLESSKFRRALWSHPKAAAWTDAPTPRAKGRESSRRRRDRDTTAARWHAEGDEGTRRASPRYRRCMSRNHGRCRTRLRPAAPGGEAAGGSAPRGERCSPKLHGQTHAPGSERRSDRAGECPRRQASVPGRVDPESELRCGFPGRRQPTGRSGVQTGNAASKATGPRPEGRTSVSVR